MTFHAPQKKIQPEEREFFSENLQVMWNLKIIK